jgi:hypothetical protein
MNIQKLKRRFETAVKRRRRLTRELAETLNHTIAYGPFKGLKLTPSARSGSDRGAILLGLYEKEVVDQLVAEKGSYTVFVNLGAADGYFGLGLLVNNHYKKSYCFEATEQSREALAANAKLNNLSERVVIHGFADKDFHTKIPAEDLRQAAILVDIEGGEFNILDKACFSTLARNLFIVELHEDGHKTNGQVQAIIDAAAPTHSHVFTTTGARDLSSMAEIAQLRDTDRWLMCSESRPCMMRWLVLTPR